MPGFRPRARILSASHFIPWGNFSLPFQSPCHRWNPSSTWTYSNPRGRSARAANSAFRSTSSSVTSPNEQNQLHQPFTTDRGRAPQAAPIAAAWSSMAVQGSGPIPMRKGFDATEPPGARTKPGP